MAPRIGFLGAGWTAHLHLHAFGLHEVVDAVDRSTANGGIRVDLA